MEYYVYRFYSELKGYNSKIWRRFEIDGTKTMAEFAYIVMIMYEMQASHLFSIRQDMKVTLRKFLELVGSDEANLLEDIRYELPMEDKYYNSNERIEAADYVKLQTVTKSDNLQLFLEYDFGDGWEVSLTLEKCAKKEISLSVLPRVIEGEGYGIVEDVGGIDGLKMLAAILKKRSGKEFKEYVSWLDSETLNLEEFDIVDMNFRLKKLLRVYRDIYEYNYPPSEESLNLLLREYKGRGSRGY